MLSTKDVAGYLRPLVEQAESLTAIAIPGETATLPAEDTAAAADSVGFRAQMAGSVEEALRNVLRREPMARVLICGSLYLAGAVLRENG